MIIGSKTSRYISWLFLNAEDDSLFEIQQNESISFGATSALKFGTQHWRKVLNLSVAVFKNAEDEVAIIVIDGWGAEALPVPLK